jgi:hypothetical protein
MVSNSSGGSFKIDFVDPEIDRAAAQGPQHRGTPAGRKARSHMAEIRIGNRRRLPPDPTPKTAPFGFGQA